MKNLLGILAMLICTMTVVQVDAQRSCNSMEAVKKFVKAQR